jgi:hypothetical protein
LFCNSKEEEEKIQIRVKKYINMQVSADMLVKYVIGIWCPISSIELMQNASKPK